MSTDSDFRVLVDWEDPGGVRSPELSATWCRLEIWVGDECLTRIEEDGTNASRRSLYVPLYPFAEWIAYNWWYLLAHQRPSRVLIRDRTYATLVANRHHRNDWLRYHNLRSAGEGFPWPDLTFVPEGEGTRITWVKSGHHVRGGLRYLSSGDALVRSDNLRRTLIDVVETALTRLEESGIRDTRLHEEWKGIQDLDQDEVAFCEAAARLGQDPFGVSDELAASLLEAGAALDGELLSDFLDAVDPARINPTLIWVLEASKAIHALSAPKLFDLSELRDFVAATPLGLDAVDPWFSGLSRARAARNYLGLEVLQPAAIDDFVSQGVLDAPVRQMEAYGTTQNGTRLILGRPSRASSARFASARALWHTLTESTGQPFVLTRAHTIRQKAERAFAAEFLAPAEGIQQLLEPGGSLYGAEDVEEIAERYGVSTMLIEHQIENHVELGV